MKTFTAVLVALALGGSSLAHALASPTSINPLDFDFNGNGRIDPGDEANAFAAAWNKVRADGTVEPKLAFVPVNTVAVNEVVTAAAPSNKKAKADKGSDQKPSAAPTAAFYLGLSLDDDPNLLSGSKPLTPMKGAQFQITQDFLQNDLTLTGQGAAYLGYSNPAAEDGWILGTTFDIVRDNNPKKVVDQLDFVGGYQAIVTGGKFIETNVFHLWAKEETDSEFKSSVLTANADWKPNSLKHIQLNHAKFDDSGFLGFTPILALNAQISEVLNPGDKLALQTQSSYYGIGSTVGLQFWLTPRDANGTRYALAHALVSYSNAYGSLTNGDTYQGLFKAHGDIYLGSPNIALAAEYKKGKNPYSGETLDQIFAGLTVMIAPTAADDSEN